MTAAVEQATSLAAELISSTYAAADKAEGRRNCTRILAQLKRGVVSKLLREESWELLVADGGGVAIDGGNATSIASWLISIADNIDDFPTEGHRESSVELLKGLFHRAFSAEEDGEEGGTALGKEERHQATLIRLFQRCSCTFQSRMSRCQTPSKDVFHHGTATEPAEPSEHIRLLLVELMVDMGGYCSASLEDECSEEGSGRNDVIEAASNLCHTLAKSALLDPCPEVQRAACDLVEALARLCPLAVRMNATSLLVPLTGKLDEVTGGAGQQSASSAAALSKKCLFRHRHSKTRCKAVDASAAVVMCCPREGPSGSDKAASGSDTQDDMQPSVADHLSSYGNRSSSMEQMLLDTLLPVWEDLLKMDPSATVQIAVLKCLGNVATVLDWEQPPKPLAANTSNTDVPSQAKARVLALLFAGMSPGSANQVRAMAVQNLTCLPNGTSESSTNEHSLPRDILAAYFQPVLELILDACSREWAPCQSTVRSLGALQVLLLSVAIPLMEDDASSATKVTLSNGMVRSIMDILSKNILSEEKDVLESALACCRILGCNNHGVAAIYTSGDTKENVQTNDADSVDDQQMAIGSSPRQMTSMLLTLDGMMKGCLRNKDAVSILHDIDPGLVIPTPSWFPFSATAISSILCNPTIIKHVASNSSLAWALSDACGSFVQCVQQPQGDNDQWDQPKDVIINLLISITYLLSCPGEFDISPHAMSALEFFSSSQSCEAPSSLLDTHFREVLQRITSSAPQYPWQQSDPPFLTMDALLRACSGFTVGSNFDLVAPFFLSHLATAAYSKNDNGSDSAHDQSLIGSTAKDELAEEYSLRLSLMALLQTILSDESFAQTLSPGESGRSSFSAQFTTDVLLSLVVPNLVWKAGGMASALRKLSAFTLLSLLRASDRSQTEGERGSALLHSETATSLIPILHSNLEDTESTTRELSCACLTLALEQMSTETFQTIWETNPRVIDTLHPRLLALLDDSHDAVRIGACKALEAFLIVAHATASRSSFDLGLSALDGIIAILLIQLDDPNEEIQSNVFHVLSVLIQLQYDESSPKEAVVGMIKRKLNTSSNVHRDGSYCRVLLQKIQAGK